MAMNKPLIWIIDEEWPDYDVEKELLQGAFPEGEIRFSGNDYGDDLADFGWKADAILCQIYVDMPGETIARLERCRIISVFGGGYDRVDYKAARQKGMEVTFVPGYCVEDVSDHVIASIYHGNKKITTYGRAIKEGYWGALAVKEPVRRIGGATLFIIGLGRIGSAVAVKAKALGMKVVAFDPYVETGHFRSLGVTPVTWEEGFREADFLSINAKLTEETEGMVDAEALALMKPSAQVINTARGALVDEEALIDAVRSGRLAGASLDVIRREPPCLDDPVFHCPNILVTPHISYFSEQSFRELRQRATQNVIDVLQGRPVRDRVDAE